LDAYHAALSLGTIIGTKRMWREDSLHHIETGAAANNGIKSVIIHYKFGNFGTLLPMKLAADSLIYSATFPALPKGTHIHYYIEARDNADTSTFLPRNAPDSMFDFYIGDTIIKPAKTVQENISTPELTLSPNPAHDEID